MNRYNYLVFHTNSLFHLFDMMRYDRLFFARKSDVNQIIEAVNQNKLWQKFAFVMGNYAWQKHNLTEARLLCSQRYETLKHSDLFDLDADFTHAKPVKNLKNRITWEFTGTLSDVLHEMYENHAYPENESVSRKIERAFYHQDEVFTVALAKYSEKEEYAAAF